MSTPPSEAIAATRRSVWIALCMLLACGDSGDDRAAADAGDGDGGNDRDAAAQQAQGFDACDLGGRWAVERVGFASVDSALVTGPQKATRWYYIEASQDGEEVTFDRALWCGDHTTGSATVRYSNDSLAALRPMMVSHGRRGSFSRQGDDGCALSLERVYWLLGVQPRADYLPGAVTPPGRVDGSPALADLPALPVVEDGAVIDADGDGNPGIRMLIVDTPIGSGVRHALQRGWEEMSGTASGSDDDFTVPVAYDFEQIALSAMPEAFKSNAFVREGSPHTARFVRVGGPATGAAGGDDFPGADSDDATLCEAVQALLPHRAEPADRF